MSNAVLVSIYIGVSYKCNIQTFLFRTLNLIEDLGYYNNIKLKNGQKNIKTIILPFHSTTIVAYRKHIHSPRDQEKETIGESIKPDTVALSKEARKKTVDRLRSKRIATIAKSNQSSLNVSDSTSEDSSNGSASEDDQSDEDSDYSSDESYDDGELANLYLNWF